MVPEALSPQNATIAVLNTEYLSLQCQFKSRPAASVEWEILQSEIYSVSEQEDESGGERHLETWSSRNLTWNTPDPEVRKGGSGTLLCMANNTVAGEAITAVTIDVQREYANITQSDQHPSIAIGGWCGQQLIEYKDRIYSAVTEYSSLNTQTSIHILYRDINRINISLFRLLSVDTRPNTWRNWGWLIL